LISNRIYFIFFVIWGLLSAEFAFAQEIPAKETPYSRARRLAFNKEYSASLQICDSFLTQVPDNYDFEMLNARVLSWDGQLVESEKKCQSLNGKYPDSKEVYVHWITVNRWLEDHTSAADIGKKALAKFPSDPELMYQLGKEYGALSKFDEGFELCDSLLQMNKKVDDAFKLKIDLLLQTEQYDSAITICDSLIQVKPGDNGLRLLRAKGKAWDKQYDASRLDIDTIFDSEVEHLGAHHLKTNTYLWQPQNDSAIWSADSGLQFHKEDLVLKVMMAKAYLRLDSFPPCDSVIGIVLNEDTVHYGAWAVNLNSRLAQEDFDSVIAATDKLGTIYPGDEEFKRLRVIALAGKEKYKDAIETMANDVSEVDSMDESSKVLYTKLHYWDGQNTRALDLCDRFLEQEPESVGLLTIKAIIQKSRYEKEPALATIDEGLAIDPSNQELMDLRVEVEEMNLNELGGWLTYDLYSNSVDPSGDRKAITLEYLRRIKRHVILGRLTVANRFDSTGIQGEIDFYPTITDWMYLYINLGASNLWLFPEYRAALEPYFALPYKLEASIGVRYMHYPGNGVVIYTGSVGAYPGNFWLSFRPFITFTNNGVNQSYNAKIRRFFKTPKSYLELSGGFGASPDNTYLDQAFDQAVDSQSWNIGITYQQKLGKSFYGKVFFIFDQYYPEQVPDFNIFSSNLGLWWMF